MLEFPVYLDEWNIESYRTTTPKTGRPCGLKKIVAGKMTTRAFARASRFAGRRNRSRHAVTAFGFPFFEKFSVISLKVGMSFGKCASKMWISHFAPTTTR